MLRSALSSILIKKKEEITCLSATSEICDNNTTQSSLDWSLDRVNHRKRIVLLSGVLSSEWKGREQNSFVMNILYFLPLWPPHYSNGESRRCSKGRNSLISGLPQWVHLSSVLFDRSCLCRSTQTWGFWGRKDISIANDFVSVHPNLTAHMPRKNLVFNVMLNRVRPVVYYEEHKSSEILNPW